MKPLHLMQKILPGLIIVIMIISPLFSFPKKAEAVITTQEVGANLFQSIINTISTVASEVIHYSNNYKEYVLDPLASGFAKMIIKQITSSIVNWINSGFQGSPSFVTDPGGFFLDIADQATGQFIAQSGVLTELCSNFNLDLRLALAFKYRPNVQKRYTCTLSTIIKNGVNAVENASINGFTAGDFKQGGWPAFVSLSTEPQNNVYGAYIQAEGDLSWKVFSAQGQQQKELDQGKGFLSWKKCTKWSDSTDSNTISDHSDPEAAAASGSSSAKKECLKYETQTPGSTIASALETQLGSPVRQLELADEIGEITNALFAQLVVQVLRGGLAGVNKKDSSGLSYLQKIDKDMGQNNATVQMVKKEILARIDGQITKTEKLYEDRQKALSNILSVKNIYDRARLCYTTKISSSTPPLSGATLSIAQSRVGYIDNKVSIDVAPTAIRLTNSTQQASSTIKDLIMIKDAATTAVTFEDIMGPNDRYTYLLNSGGIPTSNDLGQAEKDIDDTKDMANNLRPEASALVEECLAFPYVRQ